MDFRQVLDHQGPKYRSHIVPIVWLIVGDFLKKLAMLWV